MQLSSRIICSASSKIKKSKNNMKSKLLSIFVLSIALITSESQAQVVFDNQGGTNFGIFGGGMGFPLSRNVVGDDFDTIPTPTPESTWLVDSVNFAFLVFPEDAAADEITSYNDVQVEVSLVDLGDTTVRNEANDDNGNYTAEDFMNGTVLGSETFTLGFDGTIDATGSGFTVLLETVNFTNPINIGDGVGTGIRFEFSDSTEGSELGVFSVAFRIGGETPEPSVGISSNRAYRDGANIGSISENFVVPDLNIGLSYAVNATAVVEILLGDVNLDGIVNFLDISPFISILSGGTGFLAEADINQDGTVNFLDIAPFIGILSS